MDAFGSASATAIAARKPAPPAPTITISVLMTCIDLSQRVPVLWRQYIRTRGDCQRGGLTNEIGVASIAVQSTNPQLTGSTAAIMNPSFRPALPNRALVTPPGAHYHS